MAEQLWLIGQSINTVHILNFSGKIPQQNCNIMLTFIRREEKKRDNENQLGSSLELKIITKL